jgi:hypothetical protein
LGPHTSGYTPGVRSPTVALTLAVVTGCAAADPVRLSAPPARPPPSLGELSPPRVSNVPAWMYWEPVEAPAIASPFDPAHLPVSPAELTRSPGAEARWVAAPPALREALASRGFAVARTSHPEARLGDFYGSLRDARIPWVITLDVLFFLAHLALDRALADVDAQVLTPLVATMLRRIDLRLTAEGRQAHADLAPSYAVARGVVAVALALAQPTYVAGADIARLVAGEKARALAHASISVSPWLGAPIDYAAMSPVGMADRDEGQSGWFRAISWLENVSLTLDGFGERDASAHVDIAIARVHARAALLLARALDGGVDAESANAWDHVERAGELTIGNTDSVTPRDISAAATRAELDLRDGAWLANVVRVDRVRHAAAHGRLAPEFRLLGPRATPDGEVLQSLTFPSVGGRNASDAQSTWVPPRSTDPAFTLRSGVRALPTALDIAAWLGSAEARASLHEAGDDAYERYDETIERLIHARLLDASAASPGRHRTPYLSMIDAIETWLTPSAGDGVQPGASTSEWRKRKAEVALAAWTELRHDATALTRIPLGDVRLPPPVPEPSSVPAFVEPHPEAIAKLVGFVRQTARALVTDGALPSGSPALRVLDEVDDLLWTALGAAVYETADESLPPALKTALSTFPARLLVLDAALADSGAAFVAMAAVVHCDVPSARALEEATGRIDEAWVVMREPSTHRLWLALGASIAHHEFVQPSSQRLSDSAWRSRLKTEGDPPPERLARAYGIGPEPMAPSPEP